jgi:hypothetical protein
VEILRESGFDAEFASPDQLPLPAEVDKTHAGWRLKVIETAALKSLHLTRGVAAKLLNTYMKCRFVCAGFHKHERVQGLHPPIDRLLLNELARSNFGGFAREWRTFNKRGWMAFESESYQRTIVDLIRQALQGQPMWMVEQHWRGFQ